ncbi:MAG: hypothetical protein JO340_00815 [Acidobacteriaceae bacterium]|nr:hypothetical protein [Acidobacteriaceae bacterium]
MPIRPDWRTKGSQADKSVLPEVRGIQVNGETRCAHYHTRRDIIAIKMRCCGAYYACKDCHKALAGHEIEVWPRCQRIEQAVLCGHCCTELTIDEYLASHNRCPICSAEFNPECAQHYRFYFE